MKIFRDCVHGDMAFDPVETSIIDSPAMQRLRGIKQLGTASLVYPGAVHTRFEHSLGVCWLTKKVIASLHSRGQTVAPGWSRTASLAALLHDVTHIPFGHTFEDERRLFARHDESAERLDFFLNQPEIARALDRAGEHANVRNTLLKKDESPVFIRQLVAGAASADLLDYLHRDALHCGLALRYDERLFQLFTIVDGRLAFSIQKRGGLRRDAISEIVHLLQMRYALTERVYYHHAKTTAGAMVSRSLEAAMERGAVSLLDLYRLRDDALLYVLEGAARTSTGAGDADGLIDLVSDLVERRLYKRVYTLTLADGVGGGLGEEARDRLSASMHDRPDLRRLAERELAAELKVPECHVIVYCPSPKMSLKEADVLVEAAEGVCKPLSSLGHPDVEGLKQKHAALWRFSVFIRRTHDRLFAKAADLCAERFGRLA